MPMQGLFRRWIEGTPLCKIPFWHSFNIIFNILENSTGVDRGSGPGSAQGQGWHFGGRGSSTDSGGIPAGYEEVTGTIYLKEKMINGTFLVKTSGKVETDYASADARLLLQPVVHSSTVTLDLAKGYLKT